MKKNPGLLMRRAGIATHRSGRRVGADRREAPGEGDDWALTPAQTRELTRRVADLDDPVRYLLASRMGPRFLLYYDVSDDLYTMNDPTRATLFKRRRAAQLVARTLGKGIEILECRTRRRGGTRVLVASSLDAQPVRS